MNVLSLGVVMLATVTQWEAMFDLTGEQPGWAADAGGNGGSGAGKRDRLLRRGHLILILIHDLCYLRIRHMRLTATPTIQEAVLI